MNRRSNALPSAGRGHPATLIDARIARRLQRLRAETEREVERLLLLLDVLDGDTDLEPYLGWTEQQDHPALPLCAEGSADDLEDDDEREAIDEDGDDLDQGEEDDAVVGRVNVVRVDREGHRHGL